MRSIDDEYLRASLKEAGEVYRWDGRMSISEDFCLLLRPSPGPSLGREGSSLKKFLWSPLENLPPC